MVASRFGRSLLTFTHWGCRLICWTAPLLVGFWANSVSAQPTEEPDRVYEAPAPTEGEGFGASIAEAGDVDGDGQPDLLVGAPRASVQDRSRAGRVYLLSGTDGAVIRTITSPQPEVDGLFGYAVAGVGDVTGDGTPDVAIGAAGDSSNVGRAYLINGTNGAVLHTLISPNATPDGLFASSLVPVGDTTTDGVPDLLVGAIGEDRAYLISGAEGAVYRTLTVETKAHAHFGHLAVPGDVTGDGTWDVLVGSSSATVDGYPEAGRAYLFDGHDGRVLRTLTEPSPQHGNFGYLVAGLDDVDGDQIPDVAVGAASGPKEGGRVYVCSGADGTLIHTISPPAPKEDGYFGYSAVGIGSGNGSGTPGLLLGTRVPLPDADRAGRVYFFDAQGAMRRTFAAPKIGPDSQFGSVVATLTEERGDDSTAVLVGAPGATADGMAQAGRVYQFSLR